MQLERERREHEEREREERKRGRVFVRMGQVHMWERDRGGWTECENKGESVIEVRGGEEERRQLCLYAPQTTRLFLTSSLWLSLSLSYSVFLSLSWLFTFFLLSTLTAYKMYWRAWAWILLYIFKLTVLLKKVLWRTTCNHITKTEESREESGRVRTTQWKSRQTIPLPGYNDTYLIFSNQILHLQSWIRNISDSRAGRCGLKIKSRIFHNKSDFRL